MNLARMCFSRRRLVARVIAIATVPLLGCASSPSRSSEVGAAPGRATQAAAAPRPEADYPTHAIRLIVPFPAGGGADVWARLVASKLGSALAQPFVVENVAGQGGNRGTAVVSGSAADGYTLLLGSVGPLVVHPYSYNHLPFDAETDFIPIGLLESSPVLLLVHPDVRASSLTELVSLAKADPGSLSFATNGNGSPEQVAGELFKRLSRVDLRDVPDDGAGPARADLSRGRVTMMFDPIKAAIAAIHDGKQRPLAVADAQRSARLPDVPTFAELGYPELQIRIWTGLFAPRGTPGPVVTKLNATLRTILDDPAVRKAIEEVGGQPLPMTAEEVATFLREERTKWKRLVIEAGISRVDGPL